MPANKPVKKGTNQTEKKAKGLLANVGDYEGKTLNLTKKQLGKSGRAAASSRRVAISRTTYDKATKKVLGPMGKPLTGRVDLGGGNIAVYKNGVRVRAAKPDTGSKGGGGGGDDAGGRGAKQGKPYEERKSAIGAKSGRPAVAGSVGARQGKFGSMTLPGGGGRIARPKGAAAKPDPMDAPYRAGKTKPMPGMTAQERRINQSKTARQYPSRRVVEAQERRLDEALIVASLLPGLGLVGRAGMAARGAAAATKAARGGTKAARGGTKALPRGGSASGGYRAAQMAVPARKTPAAIGGRKTPRAIEGPKKKK